MLSGGQPDHRGSWAGPWSPDTWRWERTACTPTAPTVEPPAHPRPWVRELQSCAACSDMFVKPPHSRFHFTFIS